MTTYSSPARRTIGVLRSLCEQVGLDPEPFLDKLTDGFARYGECNHLSPDFDLAKEWGEEVLDVVAFAAVAVSRGMVARDDPALTIYMVAARRLATAQRAMLAKDRARPGYHERWEQQQGITQYDADDHDA